MLVDSISDLTLTQCHALINLQADFQFVKVCVTFSHMSEEYQHFLKISCSYAIYFSVYSYTVPQKYH